MSELQAKEQRLEAEQLSLLQVKETCWQAEGKRLKGEIESQSLSWKMTEQLNNGAF